MIIGLDHVAIAVTNLSEAIKMYEKFFGFKAEVMPVKPGQLIKNAWLELGNARIELIEPIDPNGRVGKFIASKGEGIEHIAFRVDNVEEDLKALKEKGMPTVDDKPRPSTSGTKAAFLQARGARGVSIQLVEH